MSAWAPAVFFGMDTLGGMLNARTAANNAITQSRAGTEDLRRQIAFEQGQRQQAMDWFARSLQEQIAFEQGQRQQAMDWSARSLQEQIATEQRNLQREIQVAEQNRQAVLGTLLANLAAQRESMAKQEQLIDDERSRQQQYARGQRDVFEANTGMFGGFEGQMGTQAGAIAQTIMDFIAANQPAAQAPAASSPEVAAREAALRQQASGEVATDVRNQAAVRAFGDVLDNIGVAVNRNNDIASLFGNFARGSAATLDPALAAAKMWFEQKPIVQDSVVRERYISPGEFATQRYISPGEFVTQRYVHNPAPMPKQNFLGDLLKMGAQMGRAGAFDRFFQESPYSLTYGMKLQEQGLQAPSAPNLDYMGGGQGLRLGGGNTGLVLKSNLGI